MDNPQSPIPQNTPGPNSDVQLPSQPIAAAKQLRFKNILCIEDEHFISELYTRALKKAGYNTTVVVDGQQGLAELRTTKYDIILLDIMIPGITGIEILKRLHDSGERAKLKARFIVATNLEQNDAAKAQVEKQADGYIIKAEMTPKQLVDFLQSLEGEPEKQS